MDEYAKKKFKGRYVASFFYVIFVNEINTQILVIYT